MAVTLYRQVGKGKARRYQKVNLGRGRLPADLTGPYFLRYSLADGTRPWEAVGDDLDSAIDAQKRKQAYFEALDANVPVIQDADEFGRTKITDAVFQWTGHRIERSFIIGRVDSDGFNVEDHGAHTTFGTDSVVSLPDFCCAVHY